MNIIKKLLASLTALVMAVGFIVGGSLPVFAEGEGTYTLTINGTEEGHTYTAYQIFAGDLATVDGRQILSNITAGSDLASDYSTRTTGTLANKLKSDSVFASYSTITGLADNADAATIAKAIADANLTSKSAETIELAKVFKPFIATGTGHGTASTANESTYTISGLTAGYYMVQDSATGENKNYSQLIMEVIQSKEITPKSETPTLDKKVTGVKEGDASVQGAALDDTTAVAKVGSTVSFELTGQVPNTAGYTAYTYKITDKLTNGLDFVATSADTSNVHVSVGATQLATTAYTVNVDASNRTLTIEIPKNTLDQHQNDTNKTITVTYDATVNVNAITHSFDKNTAQLEYSNNPEANTTSKTTEKNTYIVNINLDVEKVDRDNHNTKLSGAQFKLYRTRSNGETEYYKYDATNGISWTTTESDGKTFTTVTNTGKLDEEIKGLDGGTYYLKEIKAPDGYNLLAKPIEVTITATKDTTNANQVNYSVTFKEQGTSGAGENATMTDNTISLGATAASTQPKGTILVQNGAGSTLPSTGGIGTTIFYVAGGILIIAAVGMMMVRRKRNA